MTPLPLFSGSMLFVIGAFVCALAIFSGTLYAANPEKISERKAIFWVTAIVAGVFFLYVAFYATVSAIGGYRIDASVAKLKRDGAKLTLEEVIPPKIPDSENAESYYREAFAAMGASENVDTIQTRYANAFEDEWSAKDWLATRSALAGDDTRHILDLLKQGAARPKLRFTRDYDKKLLLDVLLPEANLLRCSARLLTVAAMVAGMDGKRDQAYDYIEAGLAMSEQSKSEPFIISRLVQIAMVAMNAERLIKIVRKHGIATPRAETFVRRLRALDIGSGMVECCDAKLVEAKQIFVSFSNGDREMMPAILGFHDNHFAWAIFSVWPFTRMDFACFLQELVRCRTFLREPYWKVKTIAKGKYDFGAIYPLAQAISPDYCGLVTRVARINSEIENAVQTLALEIYKNKHGAYPERLEQLVPEVLPTLPLDPYTGKPFRYEKKGATYDLNSEWLDEKRAQELKNRKWK